MQTEIPSRAPQQINLFLQEDKKALKHLLRINKKLVLAMAKSAFKPKIYFF
jgi:hypothetical protein